MMRFRSSHLKVPKRFSLEHLLPPSRKNGKTRGFETEEAALAEDRVRQRKLMIEGSPAALALAADLGSQGTPNTGASSRFQRAYRLKIGAAVLEALDGYPSNEVRMFTALPTSGAVHVRHLIKQDPKAHLERFRQQLNRLGEIDGPGFLWAVLEAELEPSTGILQFHLHGIAAGGFIDRLKQLRSLPSYRPRDDVRRPLRLDQLDTRKDRAKAVAYVLKGYWKERRKGPVGEEGQIKRERRGRRLSEPYHTQMLLWLDSHSASDLSFFMGGRMVGSKFRPTHRAQVVRDADRT